MDITPAHVVAIDATALRAAVRRSPLGVLLVSDRLHAEHLRSRLARILASPEAFHPTVLVGARNRLRASQHPRRLFEDIKIVAKAAGALGQRARVLDSTPVFDAAATEDTVIQLRTAVRKLLAALDEEKSPLATAVRASLLRDHEYATPGKPPCDWDDRAAREGLVDALVRDANAALDAIADHELDGATKTAAELLALVAGQDVAPDENGVFRIVRGVAKDRVMSTTDTPDQL